MRSRFAVVLGLLAFLILPSPVSADSYQTLPFKVYPGSAVLGDLGQSHDVQVTTYAHVWIEAVVVRGSAVDLVVDGPGACAGGTLDVEPAAAPATGPARYELDCGMLPAGNYGLYIGSLSGYVQGYLVLHNLSTDG